MKRKNKMLQIGMVALATLFGGAQPSIAVDRSVPVTQMPVRSNDATIPGKRVKTDDEKIAIPIRGNGFGEDFLFPSIASSPIWHGKSQRKKHTSAVSRNRRMKKRKSNR